MISDMGMALALQMTALSLLCGLVLHVPRLWHSRAALSAITLCLIGASTGLFIVGDFQPLVVCLVFIINTYRIFSLLRVVQNRLDDRALFRKSLRSEAFFGAVLSLVIMYVMFNELIQLESGVFIYILAVLQIVSAVAFLLQTLSMKQQTRFPVKNHVPYEKLPAITIAIPARNETSDLEQCLESVLSSDYPKLEVLVLDDCSQDNTSQIIKSFAQRGARFLEGRVPPSSWLAKNYAYNQLLEEASGRYVLFCGVDVRFDKTAIRDLVSLAVKDGVTMASILPRRPAKFDKHFLLQPMRYWRELALPRIFNNAPPVLSTCWIAERAFLEKVGGFKAYKKSARPEHHFAKAASRQGLYGFFHATSGIEIMSVKNLSAQWMTAVRVRYPEMRSRPENVFLTTVMYTLLVLTPGVVAIYGYFSGEIVLTFMALVSVILLLITHELVAVITSGKIILSRLLLFPASVAIEIFVINYSMWAYEFSKVIWKGRNVCMPVLQGNLRLPRVDVSTTETDRH